MRVLVAMSGGVDSSVAAALLVEQGHDVTGAFIRSGVVAGPRAAAGRQGCCTAEDAADAARVADRLGVPFYALDFERDFAPIVENFARSYAAGSTPNPCVACNRDLKFGRLLTLARQLGADAIATGHYAEIAPRGGRTGLRVGRDAAKDQTYVLFALSQEQLARTLLPLARMTKAETRREAAGRGLPVAEKPESMEICFVPDGDYRTVLSRLAPQALAPGDVVDAATGQVVGRHAGVGTVTVGQRRGLGVAAGRPVYVQRIDPTTNRVVVGDAASCRRAAVDVEGWNAVSSSAPSAGSPLRGRAKVRRNHAPVPAVAVAAADGRVRVAFDEPVFAPAPGQALVLYDDDGWVLGGGWITGSRD